MSTLNRRAFVQLSSGALLTAASRKLLGETDKPSISGSDGLVQVNGPNYVWEYSQANDTFRLLDSQKRLMVSGKVQPAVVVALIEDPSVRQCTQGRMVAHRNEEGRVAFEYDGVNGTARLSITWRFDENGIWIEPIVYESPLAQDVVSLHYFTDVSGTERTSSLHSTYLVVPGISEGSSVSPIVRDLAHLDENVWSGRGSFVPGLLQQWGLPSHYFCGFSVDDSGGERNMFTTGRSDAFVCGLGDLPNGDLFLNLHEGNCSPWINYRSDLWKHLRTPGRMTLGSTLFWAFGPDYYEAIGQYYQGLIQAGKIRKHENSARKTAIALTPQFCTWGAQVDRNKTEGHFDEVFLTEIYDELKASGMKAGLFSIDAKWEGSYGNLEHSAARFPHFEQFLDRARAEGYRIGMWAALMRCERPTDLGLTDENMLKLPDGKPYVAEFANTHFYILDFTQPAVAKVLADLARRFIRRYKPDLLKFDFGYELPTVADASPQDKDWTGERLMWKGLDVVIKAMREENPDLVVMYYNLSPLFLDYFDLHSPDDLFLASGEYDLEANRRFFFSSLLGPLGIPTYGSSGYDWASAPSIWFDSSAVGTIGSLNDFQADEEGEGATPEVVAKFNGITQVLRHTNTFEVLPFDTVSEAPTLGAHARSWARFEGGELVLLAFRPPEPGVENRLASRATDPRVKEAVHAVVPVVIASKSSESIARSSKLAVVAYGDGEIVIRRQQGRRATIVSHYFGDISTQSHTQIEGDCLRLTAADRNATGNPLEWIEVTIS